ncbi:DEAD/DEAH box helicase [Streptococcus sp. zg-JUN1979]|uniref:DEAD/DEAH box helicase n=1 Tax=Streptococcus sp. zg-JUN1979 TaxID=3391450 RepID=UPI0039A6B7C6
MHPFPDVWKTLLTKHDITQFTAIQEALFTPISEGHNVLGISPTGTGKTLAYLLPALLKLTPKKAQQLLILAPNSELAGQLFHVTKEWAEPIGLRAQVFLSGSSQKRQIERLKKGPEILIGTAGRIYELIKLKKIKMMSIDTIILDEFDALLSDSQYSFVERICHHVPRQHQMIYISATHQINNNLLAADTQTIDVNQDTSPDISHYYIKLDKRDKTDFLRKLANIDDFRALVFFNNLSHLGACEEKLQYHGASALSLASDVNLAFRKVILERFKKHELSLLLTTDLLARGLDIEALDYVVNAELPRDKESYIHRTGRTGRMGRSGSVINIITNKEELKQLHTFTKARQITLKHQNFHLID